MLIQIFADTKGPGECRSCHRRIEWAQVAKSGKRMPFDAPIVVVSGTERDGRTIETVDTTVTSSHFETCPDAQKFRTSRRGDTRG